MDDRAGRVATMAAAAEAGATVAAESFRTAVAVETKAGPMDPVTAADRGAQAAVTDRIRADYPGDTVVGEEAGVPGELPGEGVAWVVDPVDGTNNFVAGNRRWCTSVALVEDGVGVAAANVLPAMDDRYVARPGGLTRNGDPGSVSGETDPGATTVGGIYGSTPEMRRELGRVATAVAADLGGFRMVGSGQATLSMVAAGELDAAVATVELPPWDSVAGAVAVREAGGTVTDLGGDPWTHDAASLVASNGRAHGAVLDAVSPTGGSR
jgi:myo-inositol-1(or 4)-monophosphatase